MRVACNEEGNGDSNEGNGDKGGRQATATRAIATAAAMATGTMWAMETAMRLADNEEGKGEGGKGNGDGDVRCEGGRQGRVQGQQGNGDGDKDGGRVDCVATKRAMAMARREAGERRQWQQRGRWRRRRGWRATKKVMTTAARAMATATRVVGEQQQQGRWRRGWQASDGSDGNGKGDNLSS